MTLVPITIVVTDKGAKIVRRNLDDIGRAGTRSQGGVSLLNSALRILGGAIVLRGVVRLLDTMTNLRNRVRTVTQSTEELNAVTEELVAIANRTRVGLDATGEVYARVALGAKTLGISQAEALKITESLNQAVAISGSTASEAEGALRQFAQGLAANALRGQELNSVLEQAPVIADVIAAQLKVTRGELRKIAEQGGITGDVIVKAFQAARGELNDRFAKTVPTLSQAFSVLYTNVITFVDALNTATGFSATLASGIIFLSNNIATLATVVATAGTALFIANAQGVLAWVAGTRAAAIATALFTTTLNVLRANPIILVLTSIVLLVRELFTRFELSAQASARLASVFQRLSAIGSVAFNFLGKAVEFVAGLVDGLLGKIVQLLNFIGVDLVEKTVIANDTLEKSFLGAKKAAVEFGDAGSKAVDKLSREYLNMDGHARNFNTVIDSSRSDLLDLANAGVNATNDIARGFANATNSATAFASAARAAGSATQGVNTNSTAGKQFTTDLNDLRDFGQIRDILSADILGRIPQGTASRIVDFGAEEFIRKLIEASGRSLGNSDPFGITGSILGRNALGTSKDPVALIESILNPTTKAATTASVTSATKTVTDTSLSSDPRRNVFSDAASDRQPIIQITNYFTTPDESSFRRSERQFNRRQASDIQGYI